MAVGEGLFEVVEGWEVVGEWGGVLSGVRVLRNSPFG